MVALKSKINHVNIIKMQESIVTTFNQEMKVMKSVTTPPPPLTDPEDINPPELVDNEPQKKKKRGRSTLRTSTSDSSLGINTSTYGSGSGLNIPS